MTTPDTLSERLRRVREHLITLPHNWDGYGAAPLKAETVDAIISDIDFYDEETVVQLVPGSDGSVQAEWHLAGADVEYSVSPDGKRSLSVEENTTALDAAHATIAGLRAGPTIKPEIIRALRQWAEFEQDCGVPQQGAAIDIILDWYERTRAALNGVKSP